MEETVARADPAESRQPPEAFGAKLSTDRGEVITRRKNSVASNQSIDLGPQGNERDEIDDSEETKEQPAGEEALAAFALDSGAGSRESGRSFFHEWERR